MTNYQMKSSIIFLFAVLFIFQSCAQQPQKGDGGAVYVDSMDGSAGIRGELSA